MRPGLEVRFLYPSLLRVFFHSSSENLGFLLHLLWIWIIFCMKAPWNWISIRKSFAEQSVDIGTMQLQKRILKKCQYSYVVQAGLCVCFLSFRIQGAILINREMVHRSKIKFQKAKKYKSMKWHKKWFCLYLIKIELLSTQAKRVTLCLKRKGFSFVRCTYIVQSYLQSDWWLGASRLVRE